MLPGVAFGIATGFILTETAYASAGDAAVLTLAAGAVLFGGTGMVWRLAMKSRSAGSGVSGAWGGLLAAAAFSAGLMVSGSAAHERLLERQAGSRTAIGWRTFPGRVCDVTSVERDVSGNTGPGDIHAGGESRHAPGIRRIRSVTVCTDAGRKRRRRPRRIRVSFLDKQMSADRLHLGDRVLVTGLAERPRPAMNPFGFDEARWLASNGIHAVVSDPARVRSVHVHSGMRSRARSIRDRLRSRIDHRFARREHRALVAAILLGDRTDIDRAVRERFVESGLMHLLALSGLHVGMIGGIVFLSVDSALRRLRPGGRSRRVIRAALWTVIMTVYGTIVAWPVSVVRALVMASAFLVASTARRRCSPWHAWGLSATLLLLAAPGHLFSAGFQLSFAAVGGILLVRPEKDPHPATVRERSDGVRSMLSAARASVAAGVATMPVLLFHFGSAPTAGIVLSPPGILLMGPILASAIAALSLPVAAATPFAHASAAGMDALIALGGMETSALESVLPDVRHMPGQWSALLAAPVIVGSLVWIGGGRRRTGLMMSALAAALGLLCGTNVGTPPGPVHSIVFFAAGQGDAALVTTAAGRTMLIDIAPGAARAVIDHARATGMNGIDTVILTHDHLDHTGGFDTLTRAVSAGRVIHTGWFEPAAPISDRVVTAGDTLGLGPGIRVQVLNPSIGSDAHGNDDSIVLLVRIGRISVLFMGDAEAAAETRILERYGALIRADVVKVGHHGSATSSTAAFVRASGARVAVLSAGTDNRFGHPSPGVVRRWRAADAYVHVTAERGALVIETNGADVRRSRP